VVNAKVLRKLFDIGFGCGSLTVEERCDSNFVPAELFRDLLKGNLLLLLCFKESNG
jgi:hypothetical protein